MLESPPPPPPSLPPLHPPHPPPPPFPLPTAPGLRHSRLYDITFLTPSGARSTAGTLLLGPGRFAAASVAAEFESRRRGKSFAQVWWGHGGGCEDPGDEAQRRQGGLLDQVELAAWATPAQTPRGQCALLGSRALRLSVRRPARARRGRGQQGRAASYLASSDSLPSHRIAGFPGLPRREVTALGLNFSWTEKEARNSALRKAA